MANITGNRFPFWGAHVLAMVLPILTAFVLLLPQASFAQKFDGVADTPPMGWNSWNEFACDINENLIRETADQIVASGLKDAGYVYVNIDDCWHGERDENGFIQADPVRFPHGIKALADYIHSKGLKIGIYSDAGARTCGGRPGSQGHEYQDAMQYARWGIDYVKYDWCNTGVGTPAMRNPVEAYTTMRDAIRAAGRPMIFSICEWGDNRPWEWGRDIGHMWRTTGDIINCWNCTVNHGNWFSSGILPILDRQVAVRQYSGPGHFNDPDMMEVGNLPTYNENRAHFAMWTMLSAPLIIGTDLRRMTPEIRALLSNRDLIALDQDAAGIAAFPWIKEGDIEYWVKPLADGGWALAVLNRGDSPRDINFTFMRDALEDNINHRRADFAQTRFALKDLWTGRAAGTTATPLVTRVAGRDVAIYRLTEIH